jgi:hypothetical protein
MNQPQFLKHNQIYKETQIPNEFAQFTKKPKL